jgi:ubiquinone/menaquinone biosynthesis C-methylase UbiE/uncharacterized protein YbaR (Trm112 family)
MIPLRLGDLSLVVCPACRAELRGPTRDPRRPLEDGSLTCPGCATSWPVADGLLQLYRDGDVQGTDWLMRRIYDALPRLHRPANRFLLPLMQFRTEGATRAGYIRRLELGELRPPRDGSPLRILEVGIGDGINLDLLSDALPRGLDVELWGVDFSRGMLARCRRRHHRMEQRGQALPLRLLMADAHVLPFPDHTFDRVFHVGAAGSYHQPALALAEMARVARPGTPVVVVDEQLESGRHHGLYHRATFRMLTFYDADPHSPVELLPPGAEDVRSEAISRFYYCLRFRMPG